MSIQTGLIGRILLIQAVVFLCVLSILPLAILHAPRTLILIYVALGVFTILLLGAALLSWRLVRPLRHLSRAAESYDAHAGLPFAEDPAPDEIGSLTRSVNRILRGLHEREAALREHVAHLERANRELNEAQDRLVRSERLSTVGRLSAGIAHEVGNPLAAILGYLGLLRRGDLPAAEARDYVTRIEAEVERIHGTLRALLDYSRAAPDRPDARDAPASPTVVARVVELACQLTTVQPRMRDVAVSVDLPGDLPPVAADEPRLVQVMVNLLLNAADALSSATPPAPSGRIEISARSNRTAHRVEVTVRDNGPGIAPDALVQLFDPFFTTKPPGQGTGLGLSICKTIVEGYGGALTAENHPEGGAILRIQLHAA